MATIFIPVLTKIRKNSSCKLKWQYFTGVCKWVYEHPFEKGYCGSEIRAVINGRHFIKNSLAKYVPASLFRSVSVCNILPLTRPLRGTRTQGGSIDRCTSYLGFKVPDRDPPCIILPTPWSTLYNFAYILSYSKTPLPRYVGVVCCKFRWIVA